MTAATFQSATNVNQLMGFGIPGERYGSGPWRAEPFQLETTDPTNNIFGRAFSILSSGPTTALSVGTVEAGNTNANRAYAGILVDPKNYALYGDGVNPLNPSLTLPNGLIGQFVTTGEIVVALTNTPNVGDYVIFDNTSGALQGLAPATPVPVGFSKAYAIVRSYVVVAQGHIAVIELNPS